ncbi:MAG: acyltransferase [Legionellales bacterium]|nr:acyltransferase [Legionellales bacterium]
MKYRKEIDGLRALAVLPVVLFHAGFTVFSGGFVGVDIFFVISGFLITTIIVDEIDKDSFSLLNFYERRARRILPALFFVMLCTLPFAWFWMLPQDLKEFSDSLVAVPVFASNVLFYLTSGYFDASSELRPLLHTWSLAVEEQYYVLFPLFLMLAWGLGKKWIIFLILFFSAVSIVFAQWSLSSHPFFAFYMLPTRGFEILIGALLSLYVSHKSNIISVSYSVGQLLSIVGLMLIFYAIFVFDKNTPSPGLYTLIPTIGAGLVLLFANDKNIVGKLLGRKIFVAIGLISYSLYLWHQPLFAFVRYINIDPLNKDIMFLLVVLSALLAFLSWRFIEIPFRNKNKFNLTAVSVLALCFSMLFISIGLIGHFNGGYDYRLPAYSRDSNLFGDYKIFNGARSSDKSCNNLLNLSLLPEEVCLASSDKPNVMFAGDSHAMALYSSIYGKVVPLKALLVSGHACPIYPDLTYTPTYKMTFGNNCTNISKEVLRVAKKIKSIETIVIVNFFNKVDDQGSGYRLKGKALTNKETFVNGYDYLVKSLLLLGKRVIFVIDVPHLKFDPKYCLQKLPYSINMNKECRFTKQENELARREYINEVYKMKARFPELIIYDPTPYFCDDKFCEIEKYTHSFYNDKHHISVYASESILNSMVENNLLSIR